MKNSSDKAFPLQPTLIEKFWGQCNWTYEAWIFTRTILDGNSTIDSIKEEHPWFFNHLNIILQEYSLLQIIKLHDPTVQSNNENLSIDYIVERGEWGTETWAILNVLKQKLDLFAKPLTDARRKILAHNDLKLTMQNATLGFFKENDDREYFANLQEFVNVVSGDIRPFCELSMSDVIGFMEDFKKNT